MFDFIIWYIVISLLGTATFPLAYHLLPALADRGYAFSRALGLLIWGYMFWILGSLGMIRNDPGGLTFASALLLALVLAVWRRVSVGSTLNWMRANLRLVLFIEVLFLVGFAGWSLVRAANPGLFGTEKPMELAFINAILQSPGFPPHDPWLSGYAISYYYFGYVLAAMLAGLTGVPAGVAFNLTVSLVFALTILGAYGLVYNLLARSPFAYDSVTAREFSADPATPRARQGAAVRMKHLLGATLGPFFVALSGNLVGLLEVLHARGLFWLAGSDGRLTSPFWSWLDLQELSQPPSLPFGWYPRNFGTGFWWWWRASRVVQDYDLAGRWREIIDEFPFFSFLLADLHPHVLAIPFALLAIALALNLYQGGAPGSLRVLRLKLHLNVQSFILAALVLGGLAFLNTWDFPIYVGLFTATYVLVRARQNDWGWGRLRDFLVLGLGLGVTGVLLYLPFYVGFSSQAGGFIPNLIYVTRGAHLWVMFGLFFLILFPYLLYRWRQEKDWRRLKNGFLVAWGGILGLFLFAVLTGLVALAIPVVGDIYLDSLGARGLQDQLFREALVRRIDSPGGWLTLFLLLGLAVGLLWPRKTGPANPPVDERSATRDDLSMAQDRNESGTALEGDFIALMILTAGLLVLIPEFVFLRDQFGYRINTIFKFYYQAWMLWGVAAACAAAKLVERLDGWRSRVFQGGLAAIMVAGLVYPFFSIWDTTHAFQPQGGWTLDGVARSPYLSPEDAGAVAWLREAPWGIIAEAVGGSYSAYGRISAMSGYPSVLGWPGHESQWRGGSREMGSRESDIQQLYTTRNWDEAREILRKYNIRYVYVGSLERSTYSIYEAKFQRFLDPVFRQGVVTVYAVPEQEISTLRTPDFY